MFKAFAKINLGLTILGKRSDGFHNIETIFHRIDLHDDLRFEPSDDIAVTSSSPEVPEGESNLCHKAASLLRSTLGVADGVRIVLTKRIPVGAGLGGGSSDAATVLLHLPAFWHRQLDGEALSAIALELGSDVPYFLLPGSALAHGRGEQLEYFPLRIPFTILLCTPDIHVSTAWAYQNFRPTRTGAPPDLKALVLGGMENPLQLVNGLRNDFEPLVFASYPAVMKIKETMMRGGAEYASMSGSGSSVFGLFSKASHVHDTARTLAETGYRSFVTRPLFSTS